MRLRVDLVGCCCGQSDAAKPAFYFVGSCLIQILQAGRFKPLQVQGNTHPPTPTPTPTHTHARTHARTHTHTTEHKAKKLEKNARTHAHTQASVAGSRWLPSALVLLRAVAHVRMGTWLQCARAGALAVLWDTTRLSCARETAPWSSFARAPANRDVWR